MAANNAQGQSDPYSHPSDFTTVDGVIHFAGITKEFLKDYKDLPVNVNDVFIGPYPKSGTTWVIEIVQQIYNDGKIDFTAIGDQVLFLELLQFRKRFETKQEFDDKFLNHCPRLFKTHLQYHQVPMGDGDKNKPKYIYVARNPKDVAVSFYHHYKHLKMYEFDDQTWDEFFEMFFDNKGTKRKENVRANMGDKERNFVLECYNISMGKDWKQVLVFVKELILDAGLPQRVVRIYMDYTQERVINRMKSVVKKAVAVPSPSSSTTSKPIHVEEEKVRANQMKYAAKASPAHRKLQDKLRNEFALSSSEDISESESDPSEAGASKKAKKKKKSDREAARDAQEAHKAMCDKAMHGNIGQS